VVAQHGEQDVDAASGQADDGGVVASYSYSHHGNARATRRRPRRRGHRPPTAQLDGHHDSESLAVDHRHAALEDGLTREDPDAAAERDGAGEARDAATSDRDRSGAVRVSAGRERDRAADAGDRAADQRDHATSDRDRSGAVRVSAGRERDRAADAGDRAADQRDHAADVRDRAGETSEACLSPTEAAEHSGLARRQAAADRREAARDRLDAAIERREAGHDRDNAKTDRCAGATQRHLAAVDRAAAASDRQDAAVDGLTGVYARRAGTRELDREIARAARNKQPLIVAFLDVDGLKATNDSRGHAAGDRLLRQVVQTLRANLRPSDLVIRYGGDEFVCVLPGIDMTTATKRLANINPTMPEARVGGTITMGLAELQDGDKCETVVSRADAAFYQQRRRQRSGACVEKGLTASRLGS